MFSFYNQVDRNLLKSIDERLEKIETDLFDALVKQQAIFQELVAILKALQNPPAPKPGIAVKFVGAAGKPISKGAKK